MRRFTSILILLACLAFRPAAPAAAWWFDNTLVTIDGTNYTVDDFKHWWKYWKDDDTPLPPTADPYIDFLLLSREAARMELDQTPGFMHQTRVFLQARTLLMLKYDAINSQIKVTDDAIKSVYEEKWQPRWLVQVLEFKDEKTAMAAWQELEKGTQTVAELLERVAAEGGPLSSKEKWVRPNQIDQGWTAIFRKMAVGEVVNPDEHAKGPSLYILKEQKAGDEEDLAKNKENIRRDLWKEQENALSQKLIFQLRDKYQVKVNEERLAALDLRDFASGNFSDDPLVTTNRQNVSEKQFMAVIARLMRTREILIHELADEEKAAKLKQETVNNIIAQSVTNWEALDRHYEEKEPFKWEYEFNYKNRLLVALENRVFEPEVKVDEDEIKQYYQENMKLFTKPSVVKFYIVDETQGPVDQIWADIAVGKNFEQEIKKQIGTYPKAEEIPASHLDPEVKVVVDKLAEGETSQIFKANGVRMMVHLVNRTPEIPQPLEAVQKSIRSLLRNKKFSQLRLAYLGKIKAASEIEVENRKWKAIQKELGGAS